MEEGEVPLKRKSEELRAPELQSCRREGRGGSGGMGVGTAEMADAVRGDPPL